MTQAATPPPARQVALQKIYLKDASVEVPLGAQVFTRNGQPQMDVQVDTRIDGLGNDHWQLTLSVTVSAKLGTETCFLVEVQQAGLFHLSGFVDNNDRQAVLATYCAHTVFPFVRETVADLVQRAGFPQLLLQPINFDALYAEHQTRAKAAATPEIITH